MSSSIIDHGHALNKTRLKTAPTLPKITKKRIKVLLMLPEKDPTIITVRSDLKLIGKDLGYAFSRHVTLQELPFEHSFGMLYTLNPSNFAYNKWATVYYHTLLSEHHEPFCDGIKLHGPIVIYDDGEDFTQETRKKIRELMHYKVHPDNKDKMKRLGWMKKSVALLEAIDWKDPLDHPDADQTFSEEQLCAEQVVQQCQEICQVVGWDVAHLTHLEKLKEIIAKLEALELVQVASKAYKIQYRKLDGFGDNIKTTADLFKRTSLGMRSINA